ncbi:hypothetical protein [Candidatus Magnetomonas plexicatena]|uniref:hypothetical protein n=1 Tax=Candidatus Magnetomonas plexicatena TaxID=2552947 RepID=UPI001C754827|nr:hypothetical protein E2O03_013760 [Nitrospirales bacterium LBB_01]
MARPLGTVSYPGIVGTHDNINDTMVQISMDRKKEALKRGGFGLLTMPKPADNAGL